MKHEIFTARRLLLVEPSITLVITGEALARREAGDDIMILSAGEPDFITPKYIRDYAIEAIERGFTHYTETAGILPLRELIVKKFKEDNGLDYAPSNIIVSTGAKQSIFNVMESILDDNDEVIIPSPYWVSYPEIVHLAGGKPVIVDTEEDGFILTAEKLKKNISNRTKAIILNTPNNPTGMVYYKDTLEELADVIVENDLLCISDEIYEKVLYDGKKHYSIAALGEDIKNNTVVINGFSKSYAMTGWRIGYAAGPEFIIKNCLKLQGHSTSCPSSIGQAAAYAALKNKNEEFDNMLATFDKRRRYIMEKLDQLEGISYIRPEGAFYFFINISNFYGHKGVNDSLSFCNYLLKNGNVAVTPGKAFGMDDYIRISYAVSTAEIERAMERFKKVLEMLVE